MLAGKRVCARDHEGGCARDEKRATTYEEVPLGAVRDGHADSGRSTLERVLPKEGK